MLADRREKGDGLMATGNSPPQAGDLASPYLRILMVADVDPVHVIGGAERMLNEHCRRLAARGHRVVVLTRRDDPALPMEESFCGVRVVRHAVGGQGPLHFYRSVLRKGGETFARLTEEEGFDLINVHQPLAAAAVLRRAESKHRAVLYTYHSPWSEEYRTRFARSAQARSGMLAAATQAWVGINSRTREGIERRALSRSDRILVLSEFSVSKLRDIHGVARDRIRVIPGGIDTEKFRLPQDRAGLRRELGLPEGLLLFTVRNLVPRMGLDQLILAMQQVARVRPDCHLCIGGSGPLRSELESQVTALGLEKNVSFAGFIPEASLPDYYGTADAFVLPTRCLEGFGLVTIEALACGTPVLATPVGGTHEILRNFDTGFLFQGIEAPDMATGILERLPEIEGNDALRDRSRRYALDNYSWEVLVPRVEALMREMIGQRVAPLG
jgi:glycosyltransferase involved in cell wall biosynthesis